MPDADIGFAAPTSLSEALSLVVDDALVVAGGTSVALLLRNGLVRPDALIFLGRIGELRAITFSPDALRLGATATLAELATFPEVRTRFPALAAAASQVGNPRVRAVATVGGALVHGDPRQDLPPVLLALGAFVEVASVAGRRVLPLDQFLVGFMESALEPGELVTAVTVPVHPGQRSAYCRFAPGSADDYPTVGAAAAVSLAEDGTVRAVTLALGGVSSTAFLVDGAAEALVGRRPGDRELALVSEAAAAQARPVEDSRGSVAYKKEMAALWSRRALASCFGTGPPGPNELAQ